MRQIVEGVSIALSAIRASKARAALTILGVAIGVMVVMVMSSMVRGVNNGVVGALEQLGPRTFFVVKFFQNGVVTRRSDFMRNPALTELEARRLLEVPSVDRLIMEQQTQVAVEYGNQRLTAVTVIGRTARWLEAYGGDVLPGRSYTEIEDRSRGRIAVINRTVAEEFFGRMDPLGSKIHINGVPYRVIGVYNPPPDIFGSGAQATVIVPFGTLQKYVLTREDDFGMSFAIAPIEGITVQEAIDDVTAVMRSMRGLRPSQENNFAVVTQDRLLQNFNQVTGMFFLIMIALSSVALMVGGVGVVAVMMISVTERTREIGVRKALGAKRREILWQFLVEAATLTLIGGIVGMIGGGIISYLVSALSPLPAEVPVLSVVVALVAAALTGVGFGMVPAAKAARLDPVEALRYE